MQQSPHRSPLAWGVLIGFYLALGVVGAVLLAPTTLVGQDLATYQAAGARLWAGQDPYGGQAGLEADFLYRYPPLLAIVIPILGWPPLWFGLLAAATAYTIWLWYRTSGLPGLLVPALLIGAWGQQLLNGNSQGFVVFLLAITPLQARVGPWALALATMLKIHPVIGLVWFIGRRDLRSVASYGVACALLLILQAPWLGDFVRFYLNDPAATDVVAGLSLRAFGIPVWIAGIVVALFAAWRFAGSRYGWMLATAAQLVVLPRVLLVNLGLLLGAPIPPRQPKAPEPPKPA